MWEPKQNTGNLSMAPMTNLTGERGKPSLINGVEVGPDVFPSSFYSTDGNGFCTSTLIGPLTILTAAHCVGDGAQIVIKLSGVASRSATCKHHPKWKNGTGDISADYALCALESRLDGFTPERVDLDDGEMSAGQRILLAGYGCTNPNDVSSGGNDGRFRVGYARLDQLLGSVQFQCKGANAPVQRSYVSTKANTGTSDTAVVCPGDSGGAAYLLGDGKTASGRRRIIGINSRVAYKVDGNCKVVRTASNQPVLGEISYLSATSSDDFSSFLKSWGKQICGVDAKIANNCHR